jgi:pyruvate,water dikinase
MLVSLAEEVAVADVGGKAWSLARIAAAGLRVPTGYAITCGSFDAIDRSELDGLDVHDATALAAASERLRARVEAMALPADLRKALAALDLGPRIAVRSSAVGEDSREASFAGQLDSVLNVPPDALEPAILRCLASQFHARALFYQRTRGIALGGMGVVLQRMVPAVAAGVLFTQSPTQPNEMLVEYTYGLGEALVAGSVDPGRISIDRTSGEREMLALPESPDADLDVAVARALDALIEGARTLEKKLGGPQDIEWAIDEAGDVYFLQSRPITTRRAPEQRFSNANVNENFPEPISPFLYSVARTGYYHYFRNVGRALGIAEERLERIEAPLRHIIGVHGGRMYYNLSSIYEVLRVAPFGEQLTAYFDQFTGATGAEEEARPKDGAGALVELAAVAVQTTRQYSDLEARISTFERTVDAYAADTHPSHLAGKSRTELLADLRAFLRIRSQDWKDASLADTAAMVTYGVLARVLRAAFPGEESALHVTLLKGIPDVVSSKPIDALWELSRLMREDAALVAAFDRSKEDVLAAIGVSKPVHDAWNAYLEDWGFRGSGELMLTLPSFQEDPAALVDVVRPYVAMEHGPAPADAIRAQAEEREREMERVAGTLRRRLVGAVPGAVVAAAVERLVRATHASIRFRERARLKQALLYARLRRLMLAIGERFVADRRLARREDVFFLTHQEVEDLLAGTAMFPHGVADLVALRVRDHAALAKTTPPDDVLIPIGDYLPLETRGEAPAMIGALKGTATCGGRVSGAAAVMRDLGDMNRVTAGDILVTKQTDPGWAPVFFLVKGLVMERGGMLSHGAIIAREFGIPAVVGVRGATTRIAQGARLTVDGDRGDVELDG